MFSQTGLELLKMYGSKPNINSLNIRWVGGYQTKTHNIMLNTRERCAYCLVVPVPPLLWGGSSIEIKQTLEKGPLRP